jgi:hypothetical protein
MTVPESLSGLRPEKKSLFDESHHSLTQKTLV